MKILVADDSRAMRMIVIRQLRHAGLDDAEFLQAENGFDALELVRREQPDLILSDWNMPEMNGLEFLQALRSEGSDTPFGFVTSEGTPDMIRMARSAGATFLIAKPFTPEGFRETLEGAGVFA
ncbi:response regulator receiver protein [Acidimicrobium ferrooxidans DSM 10331]|uniref:Response regulator receiver protein n=1 Tax=Acidimicrobium ferrooxidans (strain DSM 10331 / JCM 15462 / NBRC 103882 / ICP) TaxID=525909 RepID=C7M288_ACIFD|nr:response regulator [Acidimicrobium ferrooxidans]ACU53186.1 response regulator receiver protein [Acidimicrobium ferrooxidans DSM 10331]